MDERLYRLFLSIVYFICLPFVLISYLCEPFTGDAMINFGAAKVAALTPSFPMNLDSVWEARLIGHRFMDYVLNLIASPFHGFAYMICVKVVVAVVTIAILYYFSKRVSERLQIPFSYPFIVGFLGLFVLNNYVILSAEVTSVIISMLMLAMLLDSRKYVQILSGLLVLPLLTLKGLPVLLVFIVMFAVMILVPDYLDRFKRGALTLPAVGVALIGLAVYFPHFISDVFLSRTINYPQAPDIYTLLTRFELYGVGLIGNVPIIVLSACVMLLLLSTISKEHFRNVKLLFLMWGVAVVYVLIIAEFFYIHYYLMMIPAILTICYFLKLNPLSKSIFAAIIVVTLILMSTIVASWSPGMASSQYNAIADRQVLVDNLSVNTDILQQPSTLYLDAGSIAYFFPTKSACRYVGAVPIQRNTPEWDMTSTAEYWDDLNCTLAYTGKYVMLNPLTLNMSIPTRFEVARKLDNEYTKIYTFNGNRTDDLAWRWDIYERNPDLI